MYELGVFAAFVLWCFHTVMMVVNSNSQLARNLAKVGMRISLSTGQPVAVSPGASSGGRFLVGVALAAVGLISIVLSWLSVAWWVGSLIYQRSKASGMPPAMKELGWKLRNVDMTREQIEAAMAATQAAVTPAA